MSQFPDNLISKFSRIYVSENSFKDKETGEPVHYTRLNLEYIVRGEPMLLELPVRKDTPVTPKDIILLGIADTLDSPAFNAQS